MEELAADDDAEQDDAQQQHDDGNRRRVGVQEMLQPPQRGILLFVEAGNLRIALLRTFS